MAERSHGENRRKRITIIAGPNGAGTTTFARESLPLEVGIKAFINADLMRAVKRARQRTGAKGCRLRRWD